MDLNTIAEELFSKVRGRFPSVTIGDSEGNVTNEPTEARYFEFTFDKTNDDKISISLDEEDGVVIMFADRVTENEIAKGKWYEFLRGMRMFSKKRMLNFDVRNITKSNLEKRDYQYLATNSGDSSMNESKLYGTSKLSYQNIDSARLVIKHTENIDTETPSGRTRNIGTIYIESPEGERFKYPFKHLAGARAMARHVAEGGTTYDDFGEHIVGLSEELSKLRKFKNYMGRSKVMAESLAEYMGVVHERIGTVKKRIDSLQKPGYYKEAYEGFEKPVFEEIPEDVKENWIDQLTIRQFNEELKDVFPYIYKLIGEANRVKDLGPDDLLGETDCGREDDEDEEEVDEGIGRKFNKLMDFGDLNPKDIQKRVRAMTDDQLKMLAKDVGEKPGDGSERGLQTKLINQELKRRYGIKPGKDVSEDEDPCWDNYKQVGMKKKGGKKVPNCVPKEEMEIESYFNQLMGEWMDEVTANEFGDRVEDELEKTKRKLADLKSLKMDAWKDGDKDMLQHIQKKEVQLKQHFDKLTAEAAPEEPKDQQSPLSEFILSFYDRATGAFPKGETAVLTMVEKDYGEQYIDPAKQFIEQINQTFEQHQAGSGSNVIEEPQQDNTEFDAVRRLAGL
jgi:class 3 adenylate cyclase